METFCVCDLISWTIALPNASIQLSHQGTYLNLTGHPAWDCRIWAARAGASNLNETWRSNARLPCYVNCCWHEAQWRMMSISVHPLVEELMVHPTSWCRPEQFPAPLHFCQGFHKPSTQPAWEEPCCSYPNMAQAQYTKHFQKQMWFHARISKSFRSNLAQLSQELNLWFLRLYCPAFFGHSAASSKVWTGVFKSDTLVRELGQP